MASATYPFYGGHGDAAGGAGVAVDASVGCAIDATASGTQEEIRFDRLLL